MEILLLPFMGAFYFLPFILVFLPRIICLFICYRIAMNKGYPNWMALIGLIGIMGVILIIVVPAKDFFGNKTRNYSDFDKKDPFESDFNDRNYNYSNKNQFDSEHEDDRTYYYNGDNYYHNGEKVEKRYKKCKHCGVQLDKKASFCTFCGKDI